MRHSRTTMKRRRDSATLPSMAFTSGMLPKGSVTSVRRITAERNSLFIAIVRVSPPFYATPGAARPRAKMAP